ncbi:6203_t:CDS:2, partial [Ambispora leptoticha]
EDTLKVVKVELLVSHIHENIENMRITWERCHALYFKEMALGMSRLNAEPKPAIASWNMQIKLHIYNDQPIKIVSISGIIVARSIPGLNLFRDDYFRCIVYFSSIRQSIMCPIDNGNDYLKNLARGWGECLTHKVYNISATRATFIDTK